MTADERESLERGDAHPRAVEALTDDFFWDIGDEGAPLGTETGAQTLGLFRDWRTEHPKGSVLALLSDLLARWEVADADWEATSAEAVAAAGEEDEYSLLTRDEVILALAFAQLVEEGRVDPEIQRRALLATVRQALPLLLVPWGDRTLERATRLDRMREILGRPWR
jgi:uncharacterized protein YfeS